MSALFNEYSASGIEPAHVFPSKGQGALASLTDEDHDKLLGYLLARLVFGNNNRGTRITRYSKIDKLISTWQKLSASDSEREREEDVTGRQQALPMNMPLLATHLEDMVSFFAEIYAPTGRDFYAVPPKENSDSIKELVKKMNRDTKSRKYYKELCSTFRALLKYNIGGFAVRWEQGGGVAELSKPGNRIESIDMYNYLWDPTVVDVAKIPTEAEWAARASVKNRMWVTKNALRGALVRVDKLFQQEKMSEQSKINAGSNRLAKQASFYRLAPSMVGLSMDGADERTSAGPHQTVNWADYGAKLATDEKPEIEGFEVVEMYCWVNPLQFKLVDEGMNPLGDTDEYGNGYALYRFVIIDGAQICLASPVVAGVGDSEIPHYLSHLTQDDMKEAQRSVMEMMKGFQRFISFLANVYIAGARKNVWGAKAIDPEMFDSSEIDKGDVAFLLKSKQPGRDVRTGLLQLDNKSGVEESMSMLAQTMDLVRTFYPSQALPGQIAGMDRAVKSQVSAVMQGSTRRLHMSCKLIDADMMNPTRTQCYRNIAQFDKDGIDEGLDEEIVAQVLGSGLEQLHAERVAEAMKELIFALMQNPESMAAFDMKDIMTYYSRIQNTTVDLGDFVRPQQPVATPVDPGAPAAEGVVA